MSLKYKVFIVVSVLLFIMSSYCAVTTVKQQFSKHDDISYSLIKETCEPVNTHLVEVLGNGYMLFELENCLSYNHLVMVVWMEETSPNKELLAQACVSELVFERNHATKENLTYKLIKSDNDKFIPHNDETDKAEEHNTPVNVYVQIYTLQESK